MKIAFAGNPNSGKTTMYNVLTGSHEHVGNWAGVTVDKKESLIKKGFCNGKKVVAVDLPGAYSMSAFTSEESITSDYINNEKPDVIINIVDATNLSRSLFFTTQLLELGIPTVVALNKSDINEKNATVINTEMLSEKLGCPVVETIAAFSGDKGLKRVVQVAIESLGKSQEAPYIQESIDVNDKNAVNEADKKRFAFVNELVKEVEERKVFTKHRNINDKIDAVLTNKFFGIPIFAVVMWAVFFVSQSTLGTWIAEGVTFGKTEIPGLVTLIELFQNAVHDALLNAGASNILVSIIADGIIGGVGAVVGFLPLVMIMYFLLALLEDCGYMARVSVVLDPIFKRVGLSGRSVIPVVIGTGCSVPGIMACRTIRDERERRATAMLTPFMPCGAKIPVIALLAGAFFPASKWIAPVMYFAGILMILFWAYIVKIASGYKYKKSFFIIELPDYKMPSFSKAAFSMLSRGKSYIIKAGTIILVCNAVITIMSSFDWSFSVCEPDHSILASIAEPIAVILIPLGFGAWQFAAASVSGFIAKEEVVGTLASVFLIGDAINGDSFRAAVESMDTGIEFTAVAALAYLVFNLFTPPCFAAIGAMNSEIKSKKWFFAGLGIQFSTGYICAYLVYQIGSFITLGNFGTAFVPGLIAVTCMIALITFFVIRSNRKAAKLYSKKKKAL